MLRKLLAVGLLALSMLVVFAAPAGAATSTAPASISAASTSTEDTLAAALKKITIKDFRFMPSSLTAHVGDTVRWTNRGPSMHTTTSDTGLWDSGALAVNQTFSFKFTTAGVYSFHCNIHPFMTGVITVTP